MLTQSVEPAYRLEVNIPTPPQKSERKYTRDEIKAIIASQGPNLPDGPLTVGQSWMEMTPREQAEWLWDSRVSSTRTQFLGFMSVMLSGIPISDHDVSQIIESKNELVRENAELRARIATLTGV